MPQPRFSPFGADRYRVGRIVVTLTLLLTAAVTSLSAVTSTTGKHFWYWANDYVFNEHADHVSITQLVVADPAQVAARLDALPSNVLAVVPVVLLDSSQCAIRTDWAAYLASLSSYVGPRLNKVAAFLLSDEPDNYGFSCFPGQPALTQQTGMKTLIEDQSAKVKNAFAPAVVKTWINYGQWWFRIAGTPLAQNVDWNSFDCYGPFDNCFGVGYTIPQLVDIMSAKLPNPAQSIFILPDATAFFYSVLGRRTHESELFIRALQYRQLAVTHPRVSGMIPFIWDGPLGPFPPPNINDINDSPGLSVLYRNIGLNLLTGFIPAFSTVSAPASCLIPNGSNVCAVSLSWTTTSGPNVGTFATLAGDPSVTYGPFCPGATSCSVPVVAGDYIVELRENWQSATSRLIDAKPMEARYASGAPTGQIMFTPSTCVLNGGNCWVGFAANVQNAPSAGVFLAGGSPACDTRIIDGLCTAAPTASVVPVGGPYVLTAELRSNWLDPNSTLLAQRTFSLTVLP